MRGQTDLKSMEKGDGQLNRKWRENWYKMLKIC